MWKRITSKIGNHPERLKVARVLVENGLSVRKYKIFCNDILISKARIARAATVGTGTVRHTLKTIEDDPKLSEIFDSIRSAGPSIKKIARNLDLGLVEITPTDVRIPGILATSASLLAEADISIRQAIVDDPELLPEPKLTIITEKKKPRDLISGFMQIKGVAKVSIY